MSRSARAPAAVVAAILSTILAAIVASCSDAVPRDAEIVGVRPVHWRVVWTEDPQHRALIAWSTAAVGTRHEVLIDPAPRFDPATSARVVVATRNGRFTGVSGDPELHYHHAQLDGLEPSRTYWFRVRSDDQLGPELHFVTAPADDRPFSIIAGSDSRTHRANRRAMNQRIAATAELEPDILAFAHGGDYVWTGVEVELFEQWLTDHELTITANGRVLPIIPTRGNHETVGVLFDEVFGWPGGGLGRNYYASALSPEVLWITLNTEVPGGGDQREFLAATLEDSADRRWRAAQYHQPLWPSYKTPAVVKPFWLPLFDQHRLDFAHESDGHTLKRTPPILDERIDPRGVTYIGEGGLGVKTRSPNTDLWYLQPPGAAHSAHHIWRIRFETTRIDLTAIGMAGDELDHATILPRDVRR